MADAGSWSVQVRLDRLRHSGPSPSAKTLAQREREKSTTSPCKPLEGMASGGIVRKAHGRGPGPKIRFDIDDSGLARREGTF